MRLHDELGVGHGDRVSPGGVPGRAFAELESVCRRSAEARCLLTDLLTADRVRGRIWAHRVTAHRR